MTGDLAGHALLAVFTAAAAINLASIALAAWRLRRPDTHPGKRFSAPVSVVIPCRGIEPFSEESIRAGFELDHPRYELIFCVADPADPVIGLIRRQMDRRTDIAARILTGDDRISANPKLNNCVKGWQAARHGWVILADSNVLMPRDYVQRLLAGWRGDSGLVCSPPVGTRPANFWALVECAFLNTLQARWQYAAEGAGFGFAQGKSMLWRREDLEAEGGVRALAGEIAEDAAATKIVRRMGRRVHLVDRPFEQPLGMRGLAPVWARQMRWARLRRVTFAPYFAPELFISALVLACGMAVGCLVTGLGLAVAAGMAVSVLAITYAAEAALATANGWPASWRMVAAMLVRDLMIPIVWTAAWFGAKVVWQGQTMIVRTQMDPAVPA